MLQTSCFRAGYNLLALTDGIHKYTSTSISRAYHSGSRARPLLPTSIYSTALSDLHAGELATVSVAPGRGPREHGTHSTGHSDTPSSLNTISRPQRLVVLGSAATARASVRLTQQRKRSNGTGGVNSDGHEGVIPSSSENKDMRTEQIRQQRVVSEQRRRDQLCDGYRRLAEALPVSGQKSSKLSLLNRGGYLYWSLVDVPLITAVFPPVATHILRSKLIQQQLQTRLQQAEAEIAHLRLLNDALMLGTAE